MKILIGLASFTLMLMFSGNVQACSCNGIPSACSSLSNYMGVFTGYVERVKEKDYLGYGNTGYVRVEQVFKGKVPKKVKFRWGSSSCDVSLEQGSRWLFYAMQVDKKGEVWSTSGCSGSHELRGDDNDLKYLNTLAENEGKTRISGNYTYRAGARLANAEIEVFGNNSKYKLTTDENGFYEIYGLPAGRYYLKPAIPEGARLGWGSISGRYGRKRLSEAEKSADFDDNSAVRIEIGEEKCVEADIRLESDNSIKGKIVNYQGKPLTGICANLLKTDSADLNKIGMTDCVNEDGDFLIHGFPPGRYVLSFLKEKDYLTPSFDKTFPSFFYSASDSDNQPQVFEVSAEDQFDGIEIRLPADHPLKLIEGTLYYADGTLAAEESVRFTYWEGNQRREILGETDKNGRFALPIMKNLRGFLEGWTRIFEYDVEECPQLSKYISKGAFWVDIDTKQLPLRVKDNVSNLSLKIPVTPCRKSE